MASETTDREALPFAKMSGAGNDFIVVEAEHLPEESAPSLARSWCRRGLSIGADGLIAVAGAGGDLVRVRYWNVDGSDAVYCGNGARCAARFANLRGLAGREMMLAFPNSQHRAWLHDEIVSVESPAPIARAEELSLLLDGESLSGRRVLAGVEHLLFAVGDVASIDLPRLARAVFRRDPGLEGRANISVLSRRHDQQIDLRTLERGSGETLACGSAALAAAACVASGEFEVTVWPPSGLPLSVRNTRERGTVVLSGEARLVYEGVLRP